MAPKKKKSPLENDENKFDRHSVYKNPRLCAWFHGHDGVAVAKFAAQKLSAGPLSEHLTHDKSDEAINGLFERMVEYVFLQLEIPSLEGTQEETTAVAALIYDNNVDDFSGVVYTTDRNGRQSLLPLSTDGKIGDAMQVGLHKALEDSNVLSGNVTVEVVAVENIHQFRLSGFRSQNLRYERNMTRLLGLLNDRVAACDIASSVKRTWTFFTATRLHGTRRLLLPLQEECPGDHLSHDSSHSSNENQKQELAGFDAFLKLPPEMWHKILLSLSVVDLLSNIIRVCKPLAIILSDDYFWKKYKKKHPMLNIQLYPVVDLSLKLPENLLKFLSQMSVPADSLPISKTWVEQALLSDPQFWKKYKGKHRKEWDSYFNYRGEFDFAYFMRPFPSLFNYDVFHTKSLDLHQSGDLKNLEGFCRSLKN